MYLEKIPDPTRFTSIEPLWSAQFKKTTGPTITISLLNFEWTNEYGQTSASRMFYIDDSFDKYIADTGTFTYAQEPKFKCTSNSDFKTCVAGCGEDETCIDNCAIKYECDTIVECERAPDLSCGLKTVELTYGIHEIVLKFSPYNGTANDLVIEGADVEKLQEKGWLSAERLR